MYLLSMTVIFLAFTTRGSYSCFISKQMHSCVVEHLHAMQIACMISIITQTRKFIIFVLFAFSQFSIIDKTIFHGEPPMPTPEFLQTELFTTVTLMMHYWQNGKRITFTKYIFSVPLARNIVKCLRSHAHRDL